MELANRIQVVIPAWRLFQRKKCGVDKRHARRNWGLAAHGATGSEAHRPVSTGGGTSGGGGRTLVRLDHFQDQVSYGDLDDAGDLTRLQAGQGVSQLGSQTAEGDFSHEAASVRGGINRFFFGEFAKVLAVLQAAEDFLRLALRIHEDQLQGNLPRGRAFRRLRRLRAGEGAKRGQSEENKAYGCSKSDSDNPTSISTFNERHTDK